MAAPEEAEPTDQSARLCVSQARTLHVANVSVATAGSLRFAHLRTDPPVNIKDIKDANQGLTPPPPINTT